MATIHHIERKRWAGEDSAEAAVIRRIPPDAEHRFYAVYVAEHGQLPQVVVESVYTLYQDATTAEEYIDAMAHAYSAGMGSLDEQGAWQWFAV